jgi:ABC-type nitrate/sulfonate/bicarbonate transport system substrate-binding protein
MRIRSFVPRAPRWAIIALAALLFALGVSPARLTAEAQPADASGQRAVAPQASRVTVGFAGSVTEAPMILARARGHFAAEGIELDLADFAVTADTLPGLGTGQLDVVTGGVNPAIFNVVARGVPLKIVADGGSIGPDNDWSALLVRKDLVDSGRYRTPADLRGLRIAVPGLYTVVHYVLKVLLDSFSAPPNGGGPL